MTTFTVPGPPVPWERAGRVGSRYFTKPRTAAHKQKIAIAAMAAGVRVIEKPGVVAVTMHFYLPRPKRGKYKHPIDRRDVDNLAKAVLDALNGLAWDDDGQVCILTGRKSYDNEPSTEITIHQTA